MSRAAGFWAGLVLAISPLQLTAQETDLHPRVIPVYLVPQDLVFDYRRLRLHVQAVEDVRRWYGRALDGPTFDVDPVIVHQSRHTFDEFAADDFQAWWPLLQQEFADLGLPWDQDADFKLLFLTQGAGGWAGGDSENGGIEAIVEAGTVDKGALGGLVVIGDSAVAGILNGVCPMDGTRDGTVWWCAWDTYRGTIAHELGHTWGIPHPDAFKAPGVDGSPGRWDCSVDGNTVMQCHWGFPQDSLLTYEAIHFRSLRFFREPESVRRIMLTDLLPVEREGHVRIGRLETATDDQHAAAWVYDADQGSATGYPWFVKVGAGGRVRWQLPDPCGVFVAGVGRAREAGGRGTLTVRMRDSVLAEVAIGSARAAGMTVPYCGTQELELQVTGEERLVAVIGNPRLYVRTVAGIDSIR